MSQLYKKPKSRKACLLHQMWVARAATLGECWRMHTPHACVQTIMRNLLLADWFDEGHRESLLHPKRSKPAAELLTNMRLACSVAGQTNFQVHHCSGLPSKRPRRPALFCDVSRCHPYQALHVLDMLSVLSAVESTQPCCGAIAFQGQHVFMHPTHALHPAAA